MGRLRNLAIVANHFNTEVAIAESASPSFIIFRIFI